MLGSSQSMSVGIRLCLTSTIRIFERFDGCGGGAGLSVFNRRGLDRSRTWSHARGPNLCVVRTRSTPIVTDHADAYRDKHLRVVMVARRVQGGSKVSDTSDET